MPDGALHKQLVADVATVPLDTSEQPSVAVPVRLASVGKQSDRAAHWGEIDQSIAGLECPALVCSVLATQLWGIDPRQTDPAQVTIGRVAHADGVAIYHRDDDRLVPCWCAGLFVKASPDDERTAEANHGEGDGST